MRHSIKRLLLLALSAIGITMAAFFGFYSFGGMSGPQQTVEELFNHADVQINGKRPWDLQVHDEAFYSRVLRDSSLGFGETYMEGLWDAQQLDECIFRVVQAKLAEKTYSWPALLTIAKAKLFNLQSKSKSLEVIEKHYQLGNDLYRNMLDPSLTYSCGYWKEANTLEEAQNAKYDLICKKLHLRPGMQLLDIGCGWGGFAKFAATHYGVHVIGITLSENQAEYARSICAGLPVEIRIQDYREVTEQFDRVIEIGMFEHVGAKNHREFMEIVHRCLKKDGLFLLHTIGSNVTTLTTDPWIDTYIFPNGQLPSIAQIGTAIENLFVMEDWHNFGADYDKTLMAWYENFEKNWAHLSTKYDATFYRMWRYYLHSCAASFRAREIQLWQVVLSKHGVKGTYLSVR